MAMQCSICLGSSSSLNVETSPFSSIPCGHVHHYACISQWLQASGKCPDCRTPCSGQKVIRLFLKHDSQSSADVSVSEAAAEYAQQWIEKCQTKSRECEQALRELGEQKLVVENSNEQIRRLEESCRNRRLEIDTYKERMKILSGIRVKLDKSREESERLRKECKTWKDEAEKFQRLDCVMTGSVAEVKSMLRNCDSDADFPAVRESLMCCIEALKKEMETMKSKDKEMRSETAKFRTYKMKCDEQLKSAVSKNKALSEELKERDERIKRLESKILTLEKLLISRPDVPQTQLKRYVHESPAPADLVFLSPPENGSGPVSTSAQLKPFDTSPFPTVLSLSDSPKDSRSLDWDLPETQDGPLYNGKKVFMPKNVFKKTKFARSVFGEASPASPFPVSYSKTISTISNQRLPFRKPAKKENNVVTNLFACDGNATIILED